MCIFQFVSIVQHLEHKPLHFSQTFSSFQERMYSGSVTPTYMISSTYPSPSSDNPKNTSTVMFHKSLDQVSKRSLEHPNVAAIYTNLLKNKADRTAQYNVSLPNIKLRFLADARTRSQQHHPKVRISPSNSTTSKPQPATSFPNFPTWAFEAITDESTTETRYQKPAPSSCEKAWQLQDFFFGSPGTVSRLLRRGLLSTATLETTHRDDHKTSTTDMPSVLASVIKESAERGNNDQSRRCMCDHPLLVAVAVCILE